MTGFGAFGCGFVPALRCADETESSNDSVFSKLMFKGHADTEMALVADIATVDPGMDYALYPNKVCRVNPQNLETHAANLEACPLKARLPKTKTSLANAAEDLYLLKAPAAQMDLYEYINVLTQSQNIQRLWLPFFRSLENLFRGLESFHSKGFYHMDIKIENVAMLLEAGTSEASTAKFIDFGLSVSEPMVRTPEGMQKALASHAQFYKLYGIEMPFAAAPKAQRDALTDGQLTYFIKKYYDVLDFNYNNPYDMYITNGRPKITPQVMREIFEVMDDVDSGDKRKYFEKSDMHAMGIMLHNIMVAVCNIRIANKQINYYDVERQRGYVASADLRDFLETVNKQFIPGLYGLIFNLIQPDFMLRANAQDAGVEYRRLVDGLESALRTQMESRSSASTVGRALFDPFKTPMVSNASNTSSTTSGKRSFRTAFSNGNTGDGNHIAIPIKRQKLSRRYRRRRN